MGAALKLVSDNPRLASRARHDGRSLHRLADCLTERVRTGQHERARELAALQCLSPIAIATVATWMARAGLSEAEILRVIV